jgi:hypothetical protein
MELCVWHQTLSYTPNACVEVRALNQQCHVVKCLSVRLHIQTLLGGVCHILLVHQCQHMARLPVTVRESKNEMERDKYIHNSRNGQLQICVHLMSEY